VLAQPDLDPGSAEDELTHLLEAVAESLPGGFLVLGPDGCISLVNTQLARQFGYTPEELTGQSVDVVLPGALRASHAAHRVDFLTHPTTTATGRGYELFGQRRDGSRFPVEVGLNPVTTKQGTLVLVAVADLTDRNGATQADPHAVDTQIAFERLIAEISSQFINLASDQLEPAIREALRRIAQILEVDRCTFFRIERDGMLVDPVSWEREGIEPIQSIQGKERFPWALEQALSGRIIHFSKVDDVPSSVDRESYRALGTRSCVTVPLSVGGRIVGAVGFNIVRQEREWTPENIHRCRVIASVFGNVLARRESDEAIGRALAEVVRLRDRLHDENLYLRREVQERLGSSVIVGHSPALRRILDQIQQVAVTDSTVLLLGETGTGKELFATQIHELSPRHQRPMVRVNCSAIPAALFESELFGREKGAFTDALARQIGRFELADRSSIFLDEIGDLPPEVQVKLLRVLEERQIERLGSPKPIPVDTRIIVATHRDLEQRIAEGSFREDLFYRLNVFPIRVPPLRERVDDIPLLVWRFVGEFSKVFGKHVEAISREDMKALQAYSWPGNIRELRNVVERAMIVATGTRLAIPLPKTSLTQKRSDKLADVEREHVHSVLEATNWRIRGTGGAADRLGLRPTTLETRMIKLGLKRPKAASPA